jgi:hypothetical protein
VVTVSREFGSGRGPSGRAPRPPAWLADTDLPIDRVRADTPLHRVHSLARDPIFFGPGAGSPSTWRFDSLTGAFGVLYVGLALAGAVAETLLRNPGRKMVSFPAIAERASCELRSARELRLVRMHRPGLSQVGCNNAISTGPYDVCGAWADALWAHGNAPDGIAYQSRHDSSEICIALFERPDLGLAAGPSTPLTDQLPAIANLLGRYGKSVTDLPS